MDRKWPLGQCIFCLYYFAYKAKEWTVVRMDSVRGDLKSLESFSIQDISGIVLVDEDLGHHEVCNDDGDNHWVILVNGVDTLEVPIRESDRRETSL